MTKVVKHVKHGLKFQTKDFCMYFFSNYSQRDRIKAIQIFNMRFARASKINFV